MIIGEITDITVKDGLALITVDGIFGENHAVAEIFNALAAANINIDMISMSLRHRNRMDLSFSVDDDAMALAVAAIGNVKKENPRLMCHISGNNAGITLTGTAVSEEPGVTAEVLDILASADIPVKQICASVNEISLIVDEVCIDTAVKELRKCIKGGKS